MANLDKIANVLELMADYVEHSEREKQASVDNARRARIDKIAETHLRAHGEEIPSVARKKLAETDFATLELVEDLLTKQAGAVDSLGAPVDADVPVIRTTKEAASAADEQFLKWIVS